MLNFNEQLDQLLLDLAWSLWTELGVAGVKRKHQNFLITPEELILLTVSLIEIDPRLCNESLDWCSKYHRFFSLSRLKTVMKNFGSSLNKPFSFYCATLNSISEASWPIFLDASPIKFVPSRKSCLRSTKSPALLNIRARSLFGPGARADLVTFFLTHPKSNFSASDLVEIAYSKRNLSEILEELYLGGALDKFPLRNQQRYQLLEENSLAKILGPIPEYAPSWQLIFEILLPLRELTKRLEHSSESTRVVEIRNFLITLQKNLQKLNLSPPSLQSNYSAYLNAFHEWVLEIARRLAEGDFSNKSFLMAR